MEALKAGFKKLASQFDIAEADSHLLDVSDKIQGEYPLANILPYRSFDAVSDVFENKNSYGFVLEASTLVGANEDTVNVLNGLFSDGLPQNATVNIINWTSTKVGPILDTWAAIRTKRGGIYPKLAMHRVDHLTSGVYDTLIPGSPYTVKNFRLIIAVSFPGRLNPSKKDRLITVRDTVVTTLSSINMSSSNVTATELIRILDEWLNYQHNRDEVTPYGGKWNEFDYLNHQVAPPGTSIRVEPSRLEFNQGEHEVRTLTVRSFPEQWKQWLNTDLIGDFFSDALRIPYPTVTSFCFTYGDEEQEKTRAGAKHTRNTQQSETGITKYVPIIGKQAEDWKHVMEQLRLGHKLVRGIYNIAVFAPKGKGTAAVRSVKGLYKAKGWTAVEEKFVQLQSFLCCLPFTVSDGLHKDLTKLGRLKTLYTTNCANLAPLQGEWKGMNEPYLMLTGRRGQPLFWNPFSNLEGNYNVAITGKSGMGKSVVMQEYMASMLGAGGKAVVADVGRSFKHSCQLLGGTFLEFTMKSGICINPFSRIDPESADPDYVAEAMQLIRLMARRMCRQVGATTDIENAFIDQAVNYTWQERKNKATYTTVQAFLLQHEDPRARDLGLMLSPYTKGGVYSTFFEGDCNVHLDNDLVVFELEELKTKKDLQTIVFMMVMFLVTEAMYFGDRQKRISFITDESWDLLRGEGSDEFIESIARRARKYEGNLVTGTQGVNDYYATPAARAAFENSDWLIMLGQKDESILQLKESKRLHLSPALEQALKSVKTIQGEYSELMITGPSVNAIGRLILDKFSLKLYSSKGQEFAEIEHYMKQGLDIGEAVEAAIANG
ncbi:MAG: type IV secretion system protein TraC [Gammaproteobacteria bacterium]|nr:type IV secretion system protein TraC [Gammaproteobacteria bacterium]